MTEEPQTKESEESIDSLIDSTACMFDDPILEDFEQFLQAVHSTEKMLSKLDEIMSTTYYTQVDTNVGRLYVAFKGGSMLLQMLSFEDEQTFKNKFQDRFGQRPTLEDDPAETLIQQIQAAANQHVPYPGEIDLTQLNSFQSQVFDYVKRIKQGTVQTYADVAYALGIPQAVEKVRMTLEDNPFPIVIPCHRVIETGRTLGDYVGGRQEIKKQLLRQENIAIDDLTYITQECVTGPYTELLSSTPILSAEEESFIHTHCDTASPHRHWACAQIMMKNVQARYIDWLIERYGLIHLDSTFPGIRYVKATDIYIAPRIRVETGGRKERSSTTPLFTREYSGKYHKWQSDDREQQLLDLIEKNTHIVICGATGSGKTMMLRHLALICALKIKNYQSTSMSNLRQIPLPIPLEIMDYIRDGLMQGKSLKEYLVSYFTHHGCPSDSLDELLETRLAAGNCLVLLDGLDEVQNVTQQRKLIKQINNFVAQYNQPNNRFIITSRQSHHYKTLSSQFIYCTIQEMNQDDISHFLYRWITALAHNNTTWHTYAVQEGKRQQTETVLKRIASMIVHMTRYHTNDQQHSKSLTVTPLLIQVIIIIYYVVTEQTNKGSELPQCITDAVSYMHHIYKSLPLSAIEEYLTLRLSKAVYRQYLNQYQQDTSPEEQHCKEQQHQHIDCYKDSAEVTRQEDSQNFKYFSRPDLAQSLPEEESRTLPDEQKSQSEQKLLLAMQHRTDQFINQTRHIMAY